MPRNTDNENTDPTTAGEKAQAEAEADRAEATRTTRELGKNSNGEPTIYPSDVEAVARQFNLTNAEAETLIREGNISEDRANEVKGGRFVYRQTYDKIPADATSHPLAAEDAAAVEQAAAAEETSPTDTGPDKFAPEAGPYGPHADYREPEVSAEEVAEKAGVPVEEIKEVEGGGKGGGS